MGAKTKTGLILALLAGGLILTARGDPSPRPSGLGDGDDDTTPPTPPEQGQSRGLGRETQGRVTWSGDASAFRRRAYELALAAWRERYGPTDALNGRRAIYAAALAALETGNGRSLYNHNFGGLHANENSPWSTWWEGEYWRGNDAGNPVNFRSYEDDAMGMGDLVRRLDEIQSLKNPLAENDARGWYRTLIGAGRYSTRPDVERGAQEFAALVDNVSESL